MEYPAPWNLSGRGFIFLCRPKKTVLPELKSAAGGLRWMILADYQQSNAGPYRELLYIPGRISHEGRRYSTITKIFVSTMESVVNGRKNWGIPKEIADFHIEEYESCTRIAVTLKDQLIGEVTLRRKHIPFPVTTKFFPFHLMQKSQDTLFFTSFTGRGIGRFVHIDTMKLNEQLFAPLDKQDVITAIEVNPFSIVFPEAEKKISPLI